MYCWGNDVSVERGMRKGQVLGVGRTAEILEWSNNQVLKLFREGWSSHAVRWEEKIARSVCEAGLPVPAVYGVISVKGRHGILFENVDGPSMLKELVAAPQKLAHFAQVFAELLDKINETLEELPSQRQQLKTKILNAKPLSSSLKQAALAVLSKLPDGSFLCHGDFHPDNILMSKRGPIILDWVDAARGRRDTN